MIIEAIKNGLKLQAMSAILNPNTSLKSETLRMILLVVTSSISIILAEIFLGIALYKTLLGYFGFDEIISSLITASVYLLEILILVVISKWCVSKPRTNIISNEFSLVKSVIYAFLEGYNKR